MSTYSLEQLRGAWGAGRAEAIKSGEIHPLERKFFHSIKDDGTIEWQGRILHAVEQGCFLVQLFSWLDGRPTVQKIVPFSDMLGWRFYTSKEEWLYAVDQLQN